MIDIHAHLSDYREKELKLRKENNILTCFSAGTKEEWEDLSKYRSDILLSFGIHPWQAERYNAKDFEDYMKSADFIGEIGMDSVWCSVDLDVQQRQFEMQLQMAADLNKSVILHTKGQEERIADIIRNYQGKVCVHWYSGDISQLARFIENDCYFSFGINLSDLCKNGDAVGLAMLKEIPINRMFLETDGLSAIAWSRNTDKLPLEEIKNALKKNLEFIAGERNCSIEYLTKQMHNNLLEILHT